MNKIKLSKLQKDILIFFGQSKFGRRFYWTGGTALAHFWDHRQSVDLDFFSDDLFLDNEYLIFINDLKKAVKADKVSVRLQQNRRLYLVKRGADSVKLELVFFPFQSVDGQKVVKEFGLKIDSVNDIMVNKILSTYQRNEPKDVFDLYYYLTHGPKYNFFKLVKLVEKKFGVAVEPALVAAKINQLADGLESLQPMIVKKEKGLSKKIKDFFQEIFNGWLKKQIK